MTTHKKVSVLSDVDAAYIAGLIDGEGTITLSRRHKTDNRQLVVSISNTELPLLEYVLSTVGAGKITRKKTYRDHHTPGMTYSISNRQALDLLEQIDKYLKTYKKDRSQLVLKEYIQVTPRNGKYNNALFNERKRFIEQFFNYKPA